MTHRWVIKRYKDEPIYVSQTAGEAILSAWKGGIEIISLPDNISVSASSISAVEETTELDTTFAQLTAGTEFKPEVMSNLQGDIVTNWYKRQVTPRDWEKNHSWVPHNYKLVDGNNVIWLAIRLPEYKGGNYRSRDLIPCSEMEIDELERTHSG